MERNELELIMKFVESDKRLKRLYEQHMKYEELLDDISKRRFLTDNDHMVIQKLKKEKLSGVDQMISMVREKETEFRMSA